jgi:ankyrin repeat protein
VFNAFAQGGYTALIWAAIIGHEDCVRLLLDAGANKEAKNKVCVRIGRHL